MFYSFLFIQDITVITEACVYKHFGHLIFQVKLTIPSSHNVDKMCASIKNVFGFVCLQPLPNSLSDLCLQTLPKTSQTSVQDITNYTQSTETNILLPGFLKAFTYRIARNENSHKQEQTCVYTPLPQHRAYFPELLGFFPIQISDFVQLCPQLGGKGDKSANHDQGQKIQALKTIGWCPAVKDKSTHQAAPVWSSTGRNGNVLEDIFQKTVSRGPCRLLRYKVKHKDLLESSV